MVGGNHNAVNGDGETTGFSSVNLDLDAALDESEEWSEEALSRMPMSELARIGTPSPGRFSSDWATGVKTGMPVATTVMTTRVAPRLNSATLDEVMEPQTDATPEPDDILPFETAPEPAAEPPQKVRRKISPVAPLLGALLLAGIGGGTYYLLTQATPSDDELVTPPSMPARPPKPLAPPQQAAPPQAAPPQAAPPQAAPPQAAPPKNAPQQAAPPQTIAKVPPPAKPVKPAAPKPATAPVKVASVPQAPPTPQLQAQLKRLWKQGASAKHRKDYAGARRMWTQMLQLRPNHPGVQEAIAKLPSR